MNFSEVVVGVDGRPAGRDAIALARILVAPQGRLVLAHVHGGEPHAGRGTNLDYDAAQRDDARRLLEGERVEAAVEAELVSVPAATVGRGLHHLVEARGADLLVVGSCSHGFAGRVLLGNDTRASLEGAPCAVAVAPFGYARDLARIQTIGVGYDGSPESELALSLARGLADRHAARLRVLQVVRLPPASYGFSAGVAWGDTFTGQVEEANQRLAGLEGVEGRAVLGLAGEELAAFGAVVDLLVVGSRGYGPLRRLMMGSTSEYLSSHARCPLVVLPRTAARDTGASKTDAEQAVGHAGALASG